MTMKRIIATTILVLLTIGTLNTAQAQDYTPQETVAGLARLFALEHDSLAGCPSVFSAYDACARLSYSTVFTARTLLDMWVRGFSDAHWLSGWVGDDVVVVRPFVLDDYPGELFAVAVADLGNETVILFEWDDE